MRSKNWMIVAAIAVIGCGKDDKPPANDRTNGAVNADPNNNSDAAVADSGGDVGDDDAGTPDGGPNGFVNNIRDPGGCTDGIVVNETITIDSEGLPGQFYARAAWDSVGVWVVYNRDDLGTADSPEEIFAARVGCGGQIVDGPLRLSDGSGPRNYMPVMASRDGTTHVAWIVEGNNPEAVKYVRLGSNGEVMDDPPLDITPSQAGVPVSPLVWEPDLAVFDDGSGVVAVTAGAGDGAQVALQRFDANGQPDGDAFYPFPEAGVAQKRPAVAAGSDGTIYVSWIRYKSAGDTPEEPERAVFTSVPAGATEAFPAAPLPARPLTEPNPIARYARDIGDSGEHFLVFQVTSSSRSDILVRDGADFESSAVGTFGSAGFNNFRPSVAAGKGGGVAAWYRYNESPLRNTVVLQPFTYNGEFTAAAEVAIETDTPGIPPWGPDIAWAGGSVYFVVWGEGNMAPEARIKGRWFSAP